MRFTWFVRGYYNNTVEPPKIPGEFAVEVGGVTREAISMDISVLKEREDIGLIVLIDPNKNEQIIQEGPDD